MAFTDLALSPLPVSLTPQDPGMELGAKLCPQEQSRDHLHHHPGLCQDLSYPKVIREPPNRCP